MADSKSVPQFDAASAEEAINRIQENAQANDRIMQQRRIGCAGFLREGSAQQARLPGKVSGASQIDGVSALASTHAQFVQDVSAADIEATRESLT